MSLNCSLLLLRDSLIVCLTWLLRLLDGFQRAQELFYHKPHVANAHLVPDTVNVYIAILPIQCQCRASSPYDKAWQVS